MNKSLPPHVFGQEEALPLAMKHLLLIHHLPLQYLASSQQLTSQQALRSKGAEPRQPFLGPDGGAGFAARCPCRLIIRITVVRCGLHLFRETYLAVSYSGSRASIMYAWFQAKDYLRGLPYTALP